MEKKKDIYLKTPNSNENGVVVRKLTTGSINSSDIPGNITCQNLKFLVPTGNLR